MVKEDLVRLGLMLHLCVSLVILHLSVLYVHVFSTVPLNVCKINSFQVCMQYKVDPQNDPRSPQLFEFHA